MGNGQGNVVIMDTQLGIVKFNLKYPDAALFFPGN
jgi:hypothetical protein